MVGSLVVVLRVKEGDMTYQLLRQLVTVIMTVVGMVPVMTIVRS